MKQVVTSAEATAMEEDVVLLLLAVAVAEVEVVVAVAAMEAVEAVAKGEEKKS